MKLISVVIPVLNRADVITSTLDSVVAQTMESFNLIVVDNGSEDGTVEAIGRWAEAHRNAPFDIMVLKEARRGASAARNRGLQAVDTPWVMFFDSDDLMKPGHIGRVIRSLDDESDLVGWDTETESGKRLVFSADSWDTLFRGSMATQRWCARTALVRGAGAWNDSVSLWDDIELGLRLLALNPRVKKLRGIPPVIIRSSAESISKAEERLDLPAINRALAAMEQTMPELKKWTPFKRAIIAGRNSRTAPENAFRLLEQAVDELPQKGYALRFLFKFAKLHLPGVTHITKLFIPRR